MQHSKAREKSGNALEYDDAEAFKEKIYPLGFLKSQTLFRHGK